MNRKKVTEQIKILESLIETNEILNIKNLKDNEQYTYKLNLLKTILNQKDELTKQQKKIDELNEKSSFDFFEIKRLEKENEELKEENKENEELRLQWWEDYHRLLEKFEEILNVNIKPLSYNDKEKLLFDTANYNKQKAEKYDAIKHKKEVE